MSQKMFEQLVEKPKSTKKWLFFPVSILVHGLVIAVVIAYPLLSSIEQLPKVKVITVSLAAPTLPTVPIGRKGGGGRKKPRENPEQQQPQPKPITTGRIVVPVSIPEEIEEESLEDYGIGEGFGPGIEGAPEGDPNGIPGAPTFLWGKGNIQNQAATRISHVQKPRLIKKVEPIYPHHALLARIQGRVIVEAVTDISGNVVKTTVIAGHPLLKAAAVEAVRQWVYEPYIIDGYPKPVIFTVNVNFTLQR
ncbi:MAG: energy transducer TonB [Candidatus Aminicenantes bacterium]|jgi:TonB family protein